MRPAAAVRASSRKEEREEEEEVGPNSPRLPTQVCGASCRHRFKRGTGAPSICHLFPTKQPKTILKSPFAFKSP
jgi:hypothetical protein